MNLTNFMAALDEVQPESNLQIETGGLALAHFDKKSLQWKIFFPKDPNHGFKMTVIKREMAEESRIIEQTTFDLFSAHNDFLRGGKIEIITDSRTNECGFDEALLGNTLDFSSKQLHGQPVELIDDKSKYAGFVILNQGTLREKPNSEKVDLEIWEAQPVPSPQYKRHTNPGKIFTSGKMFDCNFNFDLDSKTEIRVESRLSFSVVLTHEENISYQIIFDNDCHKEETTCDESDFKFYYRIIDESKFEIKRRFEMIPIPKKGDKAPVGSCINGRVTDLVIPAGLID